MRALIAGNSDGIGLAVTRRLLARGWTVHGLSRSPSPIDDPRYTHRLADVADADWPDKLEAAMAELGTPDVALYCAGIGEMFDPENLAAETQTFKVNLMGAVTATEIILPAMIEAKKGHFIGLSSLADACASPHAPSYNASKAGLSRFLEGLGLALRDRGVKVSSVRFGFVDTKMAKGDVRPFMIPVETAADRVLKLIDAPKPKIRLSSPRAMSAVMGAMSLLVWLRLLV